MMRSGHRPLIRTFTSLLLSYLLTISLFAPFMVRSAEASPSGPAPSPTAATTQPQQKGRRRDGELLVRFRPGVSEQDKKNLVEGKGARRGRRLRGRSGVEKIALRQGQDTDTLIEELRRNPAVELVEPNYLFSRDQVAAGDPRFSEQWALKNTGAGGGRIGSDIQAVQAWETTTGAQTTIIAVIDSGIDFTHPDLQHNQWTNSLEQENTSDDDNNGLTNDLRGWDFVANDNDPRDEQGHGTLVAGIIAAQGDNSIGISGVMWRASLMNLRVLDNTGTGEVADAVEAIDYAVSHGAQVINCSWGTDGESLALREAIERAGANGVVVVSSAGNSGRDIETEPYYPSSFGLPNQLSVASTDNSDHLISSSNYGSTHVTIAAPGKDILTTRMGGDYVFVTGTSASTPLVTGVAGLIKTKRWWQSAAGARAAILDGARKVEGLSGKISSGGILSATGALAALQGPSTPPEASGGNSGGSGNGTPVVPPPTPGFGSGGTGASGSFSTNPQSLTQTPPGSPLPDLDQVRSSQPPAPKIPAPIHADLCPDCDPGGGTPPPAGGSDPYFATARVRPQNQTGEPSIDLGSRNFNWALPLLSLPGRAGMDLNLAITYNSLVWTKQGNSIMFDADRGFPSPGFQLGVPRLETQFTNQDDGITSFLMVTPSGSRVQLKRVGTTNEYLAEDSSYIQLIDNGLFSGGSALIRMTNGTQYTFTFPNGAVRCTQIKDRNGNFITVNYNSSGQLSTIVDTLGRTVTFVYFNNYLEKITQSWGGQTHVWATFGYGNLAISTNFPGLSYLGPQGSITVLNQIGLPDGTRYNFSYTSFGQVYKISHYAADQHLLSYEAYNLPGSEWLGVTAQNDCPRFTERRDWAENWNYNAQAISYFSVDPNSAGGNQPAWSQVTTPDGTTYKELYSTAPNWQKGLTIGTEVWVGDPNNGGTKKKWTTTAWTQDDTSLSYQKNPRPYDMSIYDEAGNRRRKDIIYHASFGLPYVVREYAADATTILRQTYTEYRLESAFVDRRIIGLVSAVHVVDENNQYVSKTTYDYDWGSQFFFTTPLGATQHDDTNYGTTLLYGRGNLSCVYRWDVKDINNVSKTLQQITGYNILGSPVLTRDPSGHETSISYADSFSDNINHSTFAYPTTVTDADNFSSTSKYNYDHGGVTLTVDPKGAGVTTEYEGYSGAGRITRVTNQVNGAYTRWAYGAYGEVLTYSVVQSGFPETFTVTYFDGAGRVRSVGSDHPNSAGGYVGQTTLYNLMGRPSQQTNPTEMSASWIATGDDAAGWVWSYQAYDWKGRPTVTTFPSTDGGQSSATVELIYGGCGCAGGEVVTTRDERGRRRKLTKDVLGRLKKVEELNWDQSVYSTTTYAYDGNDQIININQQGQVRTLEYDGYGRLWKRTTPEQGLTTYTYNADDTTQTVTDARGVISTFTYNNRHLITSVTYNQPSGVAATANVSFVYDQAGKRTSMTDGLGSVAYHYDQLSRMDWEERTFSGLGTYRLSYAYNLAGELTGITGPSQFGSISVGYTYDKTGRPIAVTGSGYGGVSSYVTNISYRAFGPKQVSYGNGKTLSMLYDNRLRLTRWDVQNVLGYQYSYNYFNENSGRVTFASQLYDHTLDRSYDYDQVGRMWASHSGREARWHTGQESYSGADGPYAQNYAFDQWGNVTSRNGWGGPNSQYTYAPQFNNNKMTVNPVTGAAVQYDASGNLINDGQQTYTYDATGQQATASGTGLSQVYDGDGVRVKKVDNNQTTYYLRSSVLGKQVIAEITSGGGFQRGYVYLGGRILAIQEGNQVRWVHQDLVTKSQRLTDSSGGLVSNFAVELDPWGGDTAKSISPQTQPHRYTSYERDNNGGDEAMMRRYEGRWQRFAQPDPYIGSYDLANPQSLNRYAYTQNDPVNNADPTGLAPCNPGERGIECGWGAVSSGFWGAGNLMNRSRNIGREIIQAAEVNIWRAWEIPTPGGFTWFQQDPCVEGMSTMQLPGERGTGWYRYSPRTGGNLAGDPGLMSYAMPNVILAFINFASSWNENHPDHPIGVGDMGALGGRGNFTRHPGRGHAGGNIIDIRPMTTNGNVSRLPWWPTTTINVAAGRVSYRDSAYSSSLTQELVNGLLATGVVTSILFNDPNITGVTASDASHDNHLHVVFTSPCN